jgi:pilus assembly protein CpaF
MAVLGRFSARTAPQPAPAPLPEVEAPRLEPSLLENLANSPEPEPAGAQNLLLTSRMLDAKVRLHRKVIEEFNLSAMEKLPEEEVRRQVYNMVSQFTKAERIALNGNELDDFVSEIIDEMTGLGPIEPLLKDPTINDILINGPECVFV